MHLARRGSGAVWKNAFIDLQNAPSDHYCKIKIKQLIICWLIRKLCNYMWE